MRLFWCFLYIAFLPPFDLPYLVFDHTHLDFPILQDWKDEIQFCWRFLNKWGGGLIKSPINDVQMNVVPKALYRHWGAAASNFHKMEHIIKSTPPPISLEIENWIFGKAEWIFYRIICARTFCLMIQFSSIPGKLWNFESLQTFHKKFKILKIDENCQCSFLRFFYSFGFDLSRFFSFVIFVKALSVSPQK